MQIHNILQGGNIPQRKTCFNLYIKKHIVTHCDKGQQILKYETETIWNINFSQYTNKRRYPEQLYRNRHVYVLTNCCC